MGFGEWESPATARGAARLIEMLERRLTGEPLQYVLGRWSFRGLDVIVDERVLIPRPETELVADVALAEAERAGLRRGTPDPGRAAATADGLVADLGTGSGALALALVAELPDVQVWATDVSGQALAVARANLAAVGLAASRVRLAEGVWYEALPAELQGRLQLIVANPPYVAESEFEALPAEVRDHEPRGALVAGPTGREALEHLIDQAPGWLAPGGAIVLELAPHQADDLVQRARSVPAFAEVAVHRDLAGRARVLAARTGAAA